MNRFKRRRIFSAVRIAVLLMLPTVSAAILCSAHGLGGGMSIGSTPSGEAQGSGSSVDSEYILNNPSSSADDILSSSIILSEGYGCVEETDTASKRLLRLKSPLEAVSDNPGDKPYPQSSAWNTDGKIIRTNYGKYSGSAFFDLTGGGQVNNQTSIPNETLIAESTMPPDFTVSRTSEPLVLIYHTHTTESYEPYVRDGFDSSFNYRTTDETKNMVMVGDAIQAELEAQGIGVIHVRTVHDYPSYNGSYGRSRQSIEPILKKYPSIRVVLDVHRDAISGEGYAYQPYTVIDGKEAAQLMIISGCDDGTLGMPDYMKNFHFACTLQQKLESDNPGLTRPILFDYRHYNQDMTSGSLLIEVGSHGNTLEQAQYTGQLFGHSLAELLLKMAKH